MKLIFIVVLFFLAGYLSVYSETLLKYGISSMLSASNTFIYYEDFNSYIAEKKWV